MIQINLNNTMIHTLKHSQLSTHAYQGLQLSANKCVLGLIETFLKKHIVLRLQGDRSTNKLVHVPGCFFLHTLMRGGSVN